VLVCDEVTVRHAGRPALDRVTVSAGPGQILGLVGPNGAGKTTLLQVACGVLEPGGGRVTVDGADLATLGPRERARRIAVVPQSARLPGDFTALETVLLGRAAHWRWDCRDRPADVEAARAAMRRTRTDALAARRLGELSGGERQLVLLARALAQEARYLLLDEPTAHLDLRHESMILELLHELAAGDRLAIVIALHDLALAARHADVVVLLGAGQVVAAGEPAKVLTAERLGGVYGIEVRVVREPATGSLIIVPESRRRAGE
jgi:iron complex transport system ATP-binding protein